MTRARPRQQGELPVLVSGEHLWSPGREVFQAPWEQIFVSL